MYREQTQGRTFLRCPHFAFPCCARSFERFAPTRLSSSLTFTIFILLSFSSYAVFIEEIGVDGTSGGDGENIYIEIPAGVDSSNQANAVGGSGGDGSDGGDGGSADAHVSSTGNGVIAEDIGEATAGKGGDGSVQDGGNGGEATSTANASSMSANASALIAATGGEGGIAVGDGTAGAGGDATATGNASATGNGFSVTVGVAGNRGFTALAGDGASLIQTEGFPTHNTGGKGGSAQSDLSGIIIGDGGIKV